MYSVAFGAIQMSMPQQPCESPGGKSSCMVAVQGIFGGIVCLENRALTFELLLITELL